MLYSSFPSSLIARANLPLYRVIEKIKGYDENVTEIQIARDGVVVWLDPIGISQDQFFSDLQDSEKGAKYLASLISNGIMMNGCDIAFEHTRKGFSNGDLFRSVCF